MARVEFDLTEVRDFVPLPLQVLAAELESRRVEGVTVLVKPEWLGVFVRPFWLNWYGGSTIHVELEADGTFSVGKKVGLTAEEAAEEITQRLRNTAEDRFNQMVGMPPGTRWDPRPPD